MGKEYRQIPIKFIKSAGQPSREVFEDIHVLAETVKRHGLLQPILVRQVDAKYSFEVVVGERRLRACRKAGLEQVPCIVVDGVDNESVLAMQLVENVQRSDLKPFEEMRIVESLKNHHSLSDEEIAVKTGLSANAVSSYLTIVKGLPDQYIRMIEKGKGRSHSTKALTLGKALLLARANLPPDKLKETVELIQRKGMTKQKLAGKLARQEGRKIKRVVAGRTFWKELTRTPRDYARYWSDFCKVEEWEDVEAYHLTLEVTMPKDLNEDAARLS